MGTTDALCCRVFLRHRGFTFTLKQVSGKGVPSYTRTIGLSQQDPGWAQGPSPHRLSDLQDVGQTVLDFACAGWGKLNPPTSESGSVAGLGWVSAFEAGILPLRCRSCEFGSRDRLFVAGYKKSAKRICYQIFTIHGGRCLAPAQLGDGVKEQFCSVFRPPTCSCSSRILAGAACCCSWHTGQFRPIAYCCSLTDEELKELQRVLPAPAGRKWITVPSRLAVSHIPSGLGQASLRFAALLSTSDQDSAKNEMVDRDILSNKGVNDRRASPEVVMDGPRQRLVSLLSGELRGHLKLGVWHGTNRQQLMESGGQRNRLIVVNENALH